MAALFNLGRIYATPAALEIIRATGVAPEDLLKRHVSGDWGNLSPEDRQMNDLALLDGGRLLSAYVLPSGAKV